MILYHTSYLFRIFIIFRYSIVSAGQLIKEYGPLTLIITGLALVSTGVLKVG